MGYVLGLDLHGVIDTSPHFFTILANVVINDGGEVHVITGSRETDEIHKQIVELGVPYTDFFSITDQLLSEGHEHTINEDGTYNFDEELWNSLKGHYCSLIGADTHYDDSLIYKDYFKTSFIWWNKKTTSCLTNPEG